MRNLWTFIATGILIAVTAGCQSGTEPTGTDAVPTAAAPAGEPCDRACLEGFVDQYLDAMIAHDPGQVPLTDDFRLTENGQRLEAGDALWKTMTGKGNYRLFVTDEEAGQVAFIGTIFEQANNNPEGSGSALALRLKIENQQIAEAELLNVRSGTGAFGNAADNLEELGAPPPVFLTPIPEDERMSRDELIRVSNMYFSGMEKNDGLGEYPFTDDCTRIENGGLSTNQPTPQGQTRPDPATATGYSGQWSCTEQFESGLIHFVWRIRDRRYVAVDPEYGLVYSFAFFDHALGEDRTFEAPGGRVVTGGPIDPWTWEIAEMFRVENGLIRQIEALLIRSPYGMDSGWSSWEDAMSSEIQDVTGL
jgi:hypothetical protein